MRVGVRSAACAQKAEAFAQAAQIPDLRSLCSLQSRLQTPLGKSGYEAKMAPPDLDHALFLRRAFDVARRARAGGDHPFGAVLVGADGRVLMGQGNGYSAEGRDMTAHAERLLASRASKAYRPVFLAGCTLYASAEPCAMCAGAIYWAEKSVASSMARASAISSGRPVRMPRTRRWPLPCRASCSRPASVLWP